MQLLLQPVSRPTMLHAACSLALLLLQVRCCPPRAATASGPQAGIHHGRGKREGPRLCDHHRRHPVQPCPCHSERVQLVWLLPYSCDAVLPARKRNHTWYGSGRDQQSTCASAAGGCGSLPRAGVPPHPAQQPPPGRLGCAGSSAKCLPIAELLCSMSASCPCTSWLRCRAVPEHLPALQTRGWWGT